jgi:hypothetical protein
MFRLLILIQTLMLLNKLVQAQVYTENNWEVIFSSSEVEYMGEPVPSNMRFTLFFHFGQNLHYNFSTHFGLFTGYGIRNIGLITDDGTEMVKRRTYALGIPLALKIGSMKEHFHFFGGGEYELFFHYKQKQLIDDNKTVQSEWFSARTERFAPSLFAGVQFPRGISIKFKYYLDDFLNEEFAGSDFGGETVHYSDYTKSGIIYLSVNFVFRTRKLKDTENVPERRITKFASL